MRENLWKTYAIGDIGEFFGGATPSTAIPEYWSGNIHWTTSKRLGPSFIVNSGERLISKQGLENSSTNLIPRGNLMVGTRVGVGKVAVNTVDVAISQDLTGVVVDKTYFNPFFLAFCFSQPDIKSQIVRQARGVTIKGIPREDLKRIEFQAPEKPDQEKIAAVLWKMQRAIEVEEKLIAIARELKQSAMRQLFTRGLRGEPQKETEIGPVPESWRVDRLIQLVHFQRGFDITKKGQQAGSVPVVSSGGIKSWHNEVGVKGPGVILGRKGSIGSVHYVEQDYWPHDTTLWSTDFRRNHPLFVYYRLLLLDFKRLDSGAANPALNRNFVHEELVSWPEDIDEQREIASALATIDRKISVHERKRATLQELFKTLLHQLMTGQIRVHDLNIDTSEVEEVA